MPAETPAAESAAAMDHSAHALDPSIPFDAAFLDDMVEHHEGAVAMANELLANTDRPELVEMANAILAAQQAEIEQMQSWRADWYPDVPAGVKTGMEMGDMAVSADESVPYDKRFLTAMIAHHEGAIGMAGMALEMAEHPELKALAETILSAQRAEVDQMQQWLKEWYAD
jgi:uncharacterized protein (DUF305 family)